MTIDRQRGREIKKIDVLPNHIGLKMGVWQTEEKIEKKLIGLHWREVKKTVSIFK
jgi:hypothetical protein